MAYNGPEGRWVRRDRAAAYRKTADQKRQARRWYAILSVMGVAMLGIGWMWVVTVEKENRLEQGFGDIDLRRMMKDAEPDLVRCGACRQEISSRADTCPHCGDPR